MISSKKFYWNDFSFYEIRLLFFILPSRKYLRGTNIPFYLFFFFPWKSCKFSFQFQIWNLESTWTPLKCRFLPNNLYLAMVWPFVVVWIIPLIRRGERNKKIKTKWKDTNNKNKRKSCTLNLKSNEGTNISKSPSKIYT